MGHKVSVIQGVKSNHYYRPGNAINEIWLSHLELISRLPFGDSDLGQAGWPTGGWPKIPWHNFIIPLKRRAAGVEPDGDYYHQVPLSMDSVSFRTASLISAWVLLSLVTMAYSLPVVLRRYTLPYEMIRGKGEGEQRKNSYVTRACIATTALLIGLVLFVMDLQALVVTKQLGMADDLTLMSLQLGSAIVGILGACYSGKVVWSLWADWWEISRRNDDDDIDTSSALAQESLPFAVSSWMERQRRP